MRSISFVLFSWLLVFSVAGVADDLVVITNAASGVQRLTRDDVVNIFMGRYKKLPSGVDALPLDQSGEKAAFYRALLGKELPEIRSYWARLVFSGQSAPPRQFDSAEEIIDIVVNNKGAIGYVDRKNVDARVSVVLELPRQ
jgi:ABC-type phosphate transport system substrate-binding protein